MQSLEICQPKYNHPKVLEEIQSLELFDWTLDGDENPNRELRSIVEMENGAIYQGEWDSQSNLRDGRGIVIWSNGSRYDGFFLNGKANGRGRIVHAEGDYYEGNWYDDKVHGYGVQQTKNGSRYEGIWINNQQNG